ncbi:N-6 DNA methylase [Clostridium butyricum]|uniref:N-6 DNA methylase n=1 Tax=Clostridium butyricum TaxID=1492 RepID=UPI0022E954BA|nr:N-6 DNA methylase [Clostridium butyricum]
MILDYSSLKIPQYSGSETTNEDIVYSFFRMVMNKRGYSFKVKRTGFGEIDGIMPSFTKGTIGKGSCDGYFFSGDKYDSFFGLIELESTGNLEKGIEQIQAYAKGFVDKRLNDRQKENVKSIEERNLRIIVYDGQNIYVSLFNLDTKKEKIYLDRENVSSNHEEISKKIISLFPQKNQINREVEEKELVNNVARIIRGHEKLQKNKAFVMTVLASIYGATRKNILNDAIEILSQSQVDYEVKLYEMWEALGEEIVEIDDQNKLVQLYKETSPQLYELSQDRGMDLYGFIYEELATKDAKKEQGEYYTPRHTIRPLIASVFENYLKWDKDELDSKIVADIFCGSGGFLYEYVHYLKNKYDLNHNEINNITEKSIYGFDKNGVLSAELNMYLIGDGNANLKKTKTSINWKKHFLYTPITNKKYDVKYIENKDAIIRNIRSNHKEINNFLKLYVRKDFEVTVEELENSIGNDELINNCIMTKLGWDGRNQGVNNLGNVDLLITNVPYGKVTDATEQIVEGGSKIYSNSLEANALRECIDLLKPARIRNGRRIEDGGVAIIIVPDSILENTTNKPIRDYLIERCDILGIVSLPEYTFSPYAMEKTYALVIQKIAPEEFNYNREINFDTFMYHSICDGKANSQNRYKTNHIRHVEINETGNRKRCIAEFVHNDFDPCFEPYSDNEFKYISKIERAWNYSTYTNDKEWDQKRLRETWNKDHWDQDKGRKWGYFNIKRVQRENKKIIKCASLEKKIECFINEKEEYEKIELLDDIDRLRTVFLSEVKVTPTESKIIDELDFIEEILILGECKVVLGKIELVDDLDLNIDSSNYLGENETIEDIDNLVEIITNMEGATEDSLINYFRNNFTSNTYEHVKLMDKFDIVQGTQFSKEDAYENPGDIPVYTAATDGPAYYVSDNINGKVKIKGPSLIWSRKGAKAGTIQIFEDNDKYFYISDVSGIIKPKDNLDKYDFTFLKYYISGQVKKELQSISNNAQLNKSKLENLRIYLPTNQKDIGDIIRNKLNF